MKTVKEVFDEMPPTAEGREMISQAVESGIVLWDDPYDAKTYQTLQAAISKGKIGIPLVPRASLKKPRVPSIPRISLRKRRISSRDAVAESSAIDRSTVKVPKTLAAVLVAIIATAAVTAFISTSIVPSQAETTTTQTLGYQTLTVAETITHATTKSILVATTRTVTLKQATTVVRSSPGAAAPPYTLIRNGTVEWYFYDMSRDLFRWTMPIDTYRYYATLPKSTATLTLRSSRLNQNFEIRDMRPYIIPSFFSKVIVRLTTGRTDKDFVREVDNVKNQIVVYGSGLSEGFQWPAETLTEGRGRCGDTTILMASMLVAGNDYAHYEMQISVWYVDSDNMASPGIANHAIVRIQFSDGSYWPLETTTNYFHQITGKFQGWEYDVSQAG